MKKLLTVAGMLAAGLACGLLAQGPLTPFYNVAKRADSSGNLLVSPGTYSGIQGPISPNPLVRADSSGNLMVASTSGFNSIADASCWTWTSNDAKICRDAANVVGFENTTTAQTVRVYNTADATPTPTNYEAIQFAWSSNVASIGTTNGGSGTIRNLILGGVQNASVSLRTNNTERFTITNNGTLQTGATPTSVGTFATAPTATTFCTSPSVTSGAGTFAFSINVGTACASSTGTITMPTGATNGYVATCHNVTVPASNIVEQTGGTTSTITLTNYARTTGVASNWTDSHVIRCHAWGY